MAIRNGSVIAFPIRDLLGKYGRGASVILVLDWLRNLLSYNQIEIVLRLFRCSFPAYGANEPVLQVFLALKKRRLIKMPMVKKDLLFRIK